MVTPGRGAPRPPDGAVPGAGRATLAATIPRPIETLRMTLSGDPTVPNLPSEVDQLAEAFWDRFLEVSPITATLHGDDRFDSP